MFWIHNDISYIGLVYQCRCSQSTPLETDVAKELTPPWERERRVRNLLLHYNDDFLVRERDAKILASRDGRFTSRALFPFDGERKVEFYELRIAPGHTERAEAHAPGTVENLVVVQGELEIRPGSGAPALLAAGDAVLFEADAPHSYRNPKPDEAVAYLVMTYAEPIG